MNDDELYELAKERIANDNGKRYSQDENRNNLHPYLDYVVETADENWSIVIRGQKMA